jgi:hypothetical protein
VTAVPLIHIPNRDIFTMYGSMLGVEEGDAQFIRNVSQPIHHQLMLNYCFGHRHSSLLLSPYGLLNTVMNHASKEHANVEIIWSKRGTRHPEWLNQSVKEWGETKHTGLAFEFVATRNILKGDEVRRIRVSRKEGQCFLSFDVVRFTHRLFFWLHCMQIDTTRLW